MSSLEQIAKASGASYRQIDYWTRKGWIHAGTPGSGTARSWDDVEVYVAVIMFRLISVGIDPEKASKIARFALDNVKKDRASVRLAPGVIIVLHGDLIPGMEEQ